MNKQRKKEPFVNIGASSLLIIFLVLSLVTFAVLTLSAAQSDYRFSQKLADRKHAYYMSSNKAEKVLEQIDRELSDTYKNTESANYLTVIENNLKSLSLEKDLALELDFSTAEPTVAFQIPMNDKQNLSVQLALTPSPVSGDPFYRITKWITVPADTWNGDNSIKLIQ